MRFATSTSANKKLKKRDSRDRLFIRLHNQPRSSVEPLIYCHHIRERAAKVTYLLAGRRKDRIHTPVFAICESKRRLYAFSERERSQRVSSGKVQGKNSRFRTKTVSPSQRTWLRTATNPIFDTLFMCYRRSREEDI